MGQYLIEAEQASVLAQLGGTKKHRKAQNDLAFEKYTVAIAMAKDSAFPMMQALSSERCGQHLLAAGEMSKARSYLQQASQTYTNWGAHGKAKTLQADMKKIFH